MGARGEFARYREPDLARQTLWREFGRAPQSSDEIEDDIEFENEDRARQREAEAAERARTHEAAARATEAATQASDAAAKAAQAASWSAQAANAATAQVTSGGAAGSTR